MTKHQDEVNAILLHEIERDEGFRTEPYRCTANKLTIGLGFNINTPGACAHPDLEPYARGEKTSITREESDRISTEITAKLYKDVSKLFSAGRFQEFTPHQAAALINMAYQIGTRGLAGFKNMIRHMEDGNFTDAKREARNSKWYKQTPNRAKRVCRALL